MSRVASQERRERIAHRIEGRAGGRIGRSKGTVTREYAHAIG
jgi:hypothetical protein